MLAALIAQLPQLPDPSARTDPGPYIALFRIGFLLGVFGHLFRSKTMVATGVALIVMATIVLPLIAFSGER